MPCSPCPPGRFDRDRDPTTPCQLPTFKVVGFVRKPPEHTPKGAELILDQNPARRYTVGVPYIFAPVRVTSTGGIGHDGSPDNTNITFTLSERPKETFSNFLIDTTSGMMQGTPSRPGVFNITLFAVDGYVQPQIT